MHILIAILGAAAAAFWAFTYFVRAANEGREAVNDVRGVIRSGRWSRRVSKRLVENLSDPREAAAVLLFQIAAYDGAVTDRQKAAIVSEMRAAFGADQETAEGLYAFARMALGEVNDAANSLKKILRPIADACTDAEKRQLVDMLGKIGEVEGALTDMQRQLIVEARRILLPAP
jgi:uncharacterized tellurite resistance protein B-like protein